MMTNQQFDDLVSRIHRGEELTPDQYAALAYATLQRGLECGHIIVGAQDGAIYRDADAAMEALRAGRPLHMVMPDGPTTILN